MMVDWSMGARIAEGRHLCQEYSCVLTNEGAKDLYRASGVADGSDLSGRDYLLITQAYHAGAAAAINAATKKNGKADKADDPEQLPENVVRAWLCARDNDLRCGKYSFIYTDDAFQLFTAYVSRHDFPRLNRTEFIVAMEELALQRCDLKILFDRFGKVAGFLGIRSVTHDADALPFD